MRIGLQLLLVLLLGSGANEIASKSYNKTELITTGLLAVGGIIGYQNAASRSRTAASLEGVLAQEELHLPDGITADTQTQETEFHDRQSDRQDHAVVPVQVEIRPTPNET